MPSPIKSEEKCYDCDAPLSVHEDGLSCSVLRSASCSTPNDGKKGDSWEKRFWSKFNIAYVRPHGWAFIGTEVVVFFRSEISQAKEQATREAREQAEREGCVRRNEPNCSACLREAKIPNVCMIKTCAAPLPDKRNLRLCDKCKSSSIICVR